MPMRLKNKLRKHKKPEEPKDNNPEPTEQSEKRLYVQCSSMTNNQYASDRKLGKIVYINDEEHPILIDNEHFTGHAVFRVRDFAGWTPLDPATKGPREPIPYTAYFDGHRRAFSIQMSGRFKKPWSADDVLFGTWFDHKLVLPRGYSVALAFAHQIDRSMTYKVDIDEPYICSPLICAMNVVHFEPVFDKPGIVPDISGIDGAEEHKAQGWKGILTSDDGNASAHDDHPADDQGSSKGGPTENTRDSLLELPKWTYFNGNRLEENLLSQWPTWPAPPTNSFYEDKPHSLADLTDESKAARHRRSWFLDEARRKAFVFHPDVVYSWDFFSPYVDVNKMQLKLGLTIDMGYYLDGQPLKYQARSKDGSVVFFEFVVGLA